jgi:hypothetical protein
MLYVRPPACQGKDGKQSTFMEDQEKNRETIP